MGKESAALDEDQVWAVREGEASGGGAWVPAGFLGRQETPSLR